MSKSVFVCRTIPERVVVGIFHTEGWRLDELTLAQAKVAAANLQACIDRLEHDAAVQPAQPSWSEFIGSLKRNPELGHQPE